MGHDGPFPLNVSHLLYADDTLIFCFVGYFYSLYYAIDGEVGKETQVNRYDIGFCLSPQMLVMWIDV